MMTLRDELRVTFLTDGLTDEQLQQLVEAGTEVRFAPGEVIFKEGEAADYLWILLEGHVELLRQRATETTVLATMDIPGQWAGGLRAWSEAGGSAGYRGTGRAATAVRCHRVPSESLGRLVGEWFPFGKHMIVGIYQTVRGIEATARQRESLVALGTLAAGLAHEINNPAAAALRAVDSIRDTCDIMLASLVRLAKHTITAEQFMALDAARRQVATSTRNTGGALATSDREESIGAWLEGREGTEAWHIAATLAAAGLDRAWCEHVGTIVGSESVGPALQWVASTMSATALMAELQDTTSRILQLVGAVKSYSQMDRAALQRLDLHEGIESTLVMLSHKLGNIEVERSFGADVPIVEAYAGDLNQVWTNLIDNAIDAMGDRGTLRVTTRRDADAIVVEIADTGHGMTPEVEARAFEPFFTTKGVGKGTGLGLDISRRIIVERHGGKINFESRPGGTAVMVRIPVSRQESPSRG
jgi:signal transduction histidine kinase